MTLNVDDVFMGLQPREASGPASPTPVSPSKIEADERSAPGPMILLEGRLLGPSRQTTMPNRCSRIERRSRTPVGIRGEAQ